MVMKKTAHFHYLSNQMKGYFQTFKTVWKL